MPDSRPYASHTRYDGTTDADPAAVARLADLERLALTLRSLYARGGAITRGSVAAALTAAHQPLTA